MRQQFNIVRELVQKVIVAPSPDGKSADLTIHGRLATILGSMKALHEHSKAMRADFVDDYVRRVKDGELKGQKEQRFAITSCAGTQHWCACSAKAAVTSPERRTIRCHRLQRPVEIVDGIREIEQSAKRPGQVDAHSDTDRTAGIFGQAASISVREKSSPLNSSGRPYSFAQA